MTGIFEYDRAVCWKRLDNGLNYGLVMMAGPFTFFANFADVFPPMAGM